MDGEAFQDLLRPVIPAEGLGFDPGLPSSWMCLENPTHSEPPPPWSTVIML